MKAPVAGHRKQAKHARAPRVRVTVTPETIAESMQRDSGHCMIAEAVKQAVPGATGVSVDLQTIRFSDPTLGRRYVYLTPRIGQVALVAFDQGRTDIPPFAFTLSGGSVVAMSGRTAKNSPNGATVPKKATLVSRHPTEVPEVVGGDRTPPMGALAHGKGAGQRRAFGIRNFER